MTTLILFVTQDAEFYLMWQHIVAQAGFDCRLATTESQAVKLAAQLHPHAVVLDCQAEDATSLDISARLKSSGETSGTRILAMIAPGGQSQHAALLAAGVDDTFLRPFAPQKLLEALGSRPKRNLDLSVAPDRAAIDFLPVELRVRINGQDLYLAPTEYRLLEYLAANPGTVFSREDLIAAAWAEQADADVRAVDVHIARLRKALRPASAENWIRTVRSAGYTFAP